MYRKEAVAGYFYPSSAEELRSFMELHAYKGEKEPCVMCLVPHAGYVYSGALAVGTLSRARLTDTVIILGTNHTGFGERIAVWDSGSWASPLGDAEVDSETAADIIRTSDAVSDPVAHVRDHSIETIIPILKYFNPEIKIVPISVMGMNPYKLRAFAADLSAYAGDGNYTLIVSSDLNHYEDEKTTNIKDFLAIERILEVDGEGLYDTVMENGISMCGVYPACAALTACRAAGARNGTLVGHSTSAAASGDYEKVVGYAGIIIK